MANSEHVEILKRGVYIWNQWRDRNPDVRPDLRAAYLREADLQRFNLRDVDLRAAVLLGANVRQANLEGADLAFGDLRFLDFKGAVLHGAKLREAKGVTEELRKATRPPTPWGKRVAWATLALLLLGGAGWAYQDPGAVEELITGVSERLSLLWEGEPIRAAGREPARTVAPGEMQPLDRSENIVALERDLGELTLPGWSILQVQVRTRILDLRVDQPRLEQEVYVPTLAAACAAVVTYRLGSELSEIRILNQTGDQGWVFQSPRGCEVLIETPPAVLRMVAASDSVEFEKPRPGRP